MDFWESRADFDRFAADRIATCDGRPRRRGAPDIHEFPVHEYLA